MKVGDKVDTGGCVGHISKITVTEVYVEGEYHYSDGDDGVYTEPWRFRYNLEEFKTCVWNDTWQYWDAGKLPVEKYV